jgi:hypothetical protein
MADPAAFAVETKQHLSHSEADQFTVSQIWSAAPTGAGRDHMVVNEHVECRQEGVQVFAHTLILNTLLPCPRVGQHFT